MMQYAVVCAAALLAAALTFFSGFGLGTLLMPAFAVFFPVEMAIAATAVVHLANNLFKVVLVGRDTDFRVALRFALPASLCAVAGALLLGRFSGIPPLADYTLCGRGYSVTAVKLVIALLLAAFSFLELSPRFKDLAFDPKLVPLGGAVSGFFGGLSGNQGALRSVFLIRTGLSKESFIATGVLCAVVIDVSRLLVYGAVFFGRHFYTLTAHGQGRLVAAGTAAAFLGSFIGSKVLTKITMRAVQLIVGWLLLLIALLLGSGLI